MKVYEMPEEIETLSDVAEFVGSNLLSYGIDTRNIRIVAYTGETSDATRWDTGVIPIDVHDIGKRLREKEKDEDYYALFAYSLAVRLSKAVAHKLIAGGKPAVYRGDMAHCAVEWFKHTLFPEVGSWAFPYPGSRTGRLRAVADDLPEAIDTALVAAVTTAALVPGLQQTEFMRYVVNEVRYKGGMSFDSMLSMFGEEMRRSFAPLIRNSSPEEVIDEVLRSANRKVEAANERISDEYPIRMREFLMEALKTSGANPVAFWRDLAERAAVTSEESTAGVYYVSGALAAVVPNSFGSTSEGLREMLRNPKLTEYKAITDGRVLDTVAVLAHSLKTLPVTHHVDLPNRNREKV